MNSFHYKDGPGTFQGLAFMSPLSPSIVIKGHVLDQCLLSVDIEGAPRESERGKKTFEWCQELAEDFWMSELSTSSLYMLKGK